MSFWLHFLLPILVKRRAEPGYNTKGKKDGGEIQKKRRDSKMRANTGENKDG